jgi:hypothetical protein
MSMLCASLLASSTMSWAGDRDGGGQGYSNKHGSYYEQDCDSLRKATFKESVTIATAKLYVEYNHTDDDIGVHRAFNDHGYFGFVYL